MNYEYISENIIICKNYLPDSMLDLIKIDLLNNRGNFDLPVWSDNTKNLFSEKCGGLDYWISKNEPIPPNNKAILDLEKWFYHQGLYSYIDNHGGLNSFQFLKRQKEHKIHVISYNNGGYYNWHKDSEHFTFNLVLTEGEELSGGNMLFMDEGRIIEVPNQNNLMILMPSFIQHCVTPLRSKTGKDVSFPQQRFSIQYWVKCD